MEGRTPQLHHEILNDADIPAALHLWASSLAARPGNENLSVVTIDEARALLSDGVVKYEAAARSPEEVYQTSCEFIGQANFSALVDDLRNHSLSDGRPGSALNLAWGRLRTPNQGMLLSTDHENIIDIAIAKNAMYCAVGRKELACQSGMIINEATALLKFKGHPIADILQSTGNVYLNRPQSKSAESFGLIKKESEQFNLMMLRELLRDVRDLAKDNKSLLLAAAVTGSTAKKNMTDKELESIELPTVSDGTFETVKKYFRLALPISMYLPNLPAGRQWYSLRPVTTIGRQEDLDEMVEDMAAAMSEMASVPVFYKGRQAALGRLALGQESGEFDQV